MCFSFSKRNSLYRGDVIKKFILSASLVVLTSFIIVGCTRENSPDENSELPEVQNPQEVLDKEFVEFQGKVAIITEETVVENPYVITTDENNNQTYRELANEKFSLSKNDMVIVIEEKNREVELFRYLEIFRLKAGRQSKHYQPVWSETGVEKYQWR